MRLLLLLLLLLHVSLQDVITSQYCLRYRRNYNFYCTRRFRNRQNKESLLTLGRFCPNYESVCASAEEETVSAEEPGVHVDSIPKAPRGRDFIFDLVSGRPSRRRAPRRRHHRYSYSSSLDEEDTPVACTPDCDQRIHSHCTVECKCDYSFAKVQRFCNPPALPVFLNLCRLWYDGCPKYERYHYASQFVYSKAEKGKQVAGPKPLVDPEFAQRIQSR